MKNKINIEDIVLHGSNFRILKAKITSDNTLDVSFEHTIKEGLVLKHNGVEGSAIVHEDLKKAFANLIPHFVLLCDLKEESFIDKDNIEATPLEQLNNIIITGLTISGNGESEGITIQGQKLIGVKCLNLNSPFQKWEDEYSHASSLGECIEAIKFEVGQYLSGRKFYAKQIEMEFEVKETAEVKE